jgi:hypothetical protein
VGAIVLTAALWAGIHMQCDAWHVLHLRDGTRAGLGPLAANSVILTCLLHAFANIYATVETLFVALGAARRCSDGFVVRARP